MKVIVPCNIKTQPCMYASDAINDENTSQNRLAGLTKDCNFASSVPPQIKERVLAYMTESPKSFYEYFNRHPA